MGEEGEGTEGSKLLAEGGRVGGMYRLDKWDTSGYYRPPPVIKVINSYFKSTNKYRKG